MKAFGYQSSGNINVIKTVNLSTPLVPADAVLIDSVAFGLNHVDGFMRRGYAGNSLVIPGFDVAGHVIQLGNHVTDFQVGDAVVAHVERGGYAEQVVAPTVTTIKLPENIALADAAGLPTVAMTAYNALTFFANVKANQTVAVLGAGGGIGSLAVQFAKQLGAHVIGIVRTADRQFVRDLGADEIGAYDSEDIKNRFKNHADVVLNMNFMASAQDVAYAIVKPTGTIATVGEARKNPEKAGVNVVHVHPLDEQHIHEALIAATHLALKNRLTVRIARRFAFNLTGVQAASELNENGHTSGRIIVEK